MKQNPLAKHLNLRNFRRRLIADAYARAKQRAEEKIARMETQPATLIQLALPLQEAS